MPSIWRLWSTLTRTVITRVDMPIVAACTVKEGFCFAGWRFSGLIWARLEFFCSLRLVGQPRKYLPRLRPQIRRPCLRQTRVRHRRLWDCDQRRSRLPRLPVARLHRLLPTLGDPDRSWALVPSPIRPAVSGYFSPTLKQAWPFIRLTRSVWLARIKDSPGHQTRRR